MRRHKQSDQGFTLIETIVVIAIVGILSTVGMISYQNVRVKSRIAKAQTDLMSIRDGVRMLAKDTDKWPRGCPVEENPISPMPGSDNEIALNEQQAGLLVQPTAEGPNPNNNCQWTTDAVTHWDGPYINSNLLDPWENPYYFDSDYQPFRDCQGHPNFGKPETQIGISAMYSMGPDGYGAPNVTDQYDCDNIHIPMP